MFALLITAISCATSSAQTVTVGSKKFTESYVLGEVIKQTLKVAGVDATHKQGLGATGIVWAALTSGQISVYPEYSGTIAEELLKKPGIGEEEMRSLLQKQGIGITKFLGFNDTYTL
ncbi:MAG: glycine betaine ABC transporter substrate-binding protein, partial [Chthonomonadales bacterium]